MCRLRNIAKHDYQESVTTGQTDRQTPDKVIPMCRYASQVTQKRKKNTDLSSFLTNFTAEKVPMSWHYL